jgi:hypothetical protein
MGRSTLARDYDIGRMLADHERRILALERRMTLLRGQAAAIGVWKPFTPVWTGVTVGTGGISAGRYVQIGQTVHVAVQLVLGTGGDVTAGINLAVPLAANLSLIFNSNSVALSGVAGARDASPSALEKGVVQLLSTGVVRFTPTDVPGGQWGVTSPFDWTVNDQLNAWFSYETTVAVPITQ